MVDVSVWVVYSGETEPGLSFDVDGGEGFWISKDKAQVLFDEMKCCLDEIVRVESKKLINEQFITNIFAYLSSLPKIIPGWVESPIVSFWSQLNHQHPEVSSWLTDLADRIGHPDDLEVIRQAALKELPAMFPNG